MKNTEGNNGGSLERVVRRSQRLHTSIALLESAAATLERASVDGVIELHPNVCRWCRSIRAQQQQLIKEFDACESQIAPPNVRISDGGQKASELH